MSTCCCGRFRVCREEVSWKTISESSSRKEECVYSTPIPYCDHGPCNLQMSFMRYVVRRFWRCPLEDKVIVSFPVMFKNPFEDLIAVIVITLYGMEIHPRERQK